MSAVREKKCFDSAEIIVMLQSLSFRMYLAAVTPAIPFPIMTICFIDFGDDSFSISKQIIEEKNLCRNIDVSGNKSRIGFGQMILLLLIFGASNTLRITLFT
jgi:hypothetical protein